MPKEVALVESIKGTSRRILGENVGEGEPVHVFMEGVRGQSVVATDRRLMIIKTGPAAADPLSERNAKLSRTNT